MQRHTLLLESLRAVQVKYSNQVFKDLETLEATLRESTDLQKIIEKENIVFHNVGEWIDLVEPGFEAKILKQKEHSLVLVAEYKINENNEIILRKVRCLRDLE